MNFSFESFTILDIILSLLFSAKIINGDYIYDFESEFARYVGVKYAISIPSARLGLYLALKYYAFPKGAEVIMTPFTHWSIFTVIKAYGLKPVFVDIDADSHNIEPAMVRKHINKNTKLILLTHMWGRPCEMDDFMALKNEYGIKIIEDCAMAAGAQYAAQKVGSFGDASIFSFGKAKAINTFGGGMFCTNSGLMSEEIRKECSFFCAEKRLPLSITIASSIAANILTQPRAFFFTIYPVVRFLNIADPYNPMEHRKDAPIVADKIPDEWKVKFANIQAAVGISQLRALDQRNEKRIANAKLFQSILGGTKDINIPVCPPGRKHIYLYYAVHIKKRVALNHIRRKLIGHGIDSQLNELTGPGELKAFGANADDYPVFKNISGNLLIIPNGIYLDRQDILYIASKFKEILEGLP